MRTLWPYADDEIIINEIKEILKKFAEEADEVDIYRNALDPFSAIFDMALQDISFDDWIENEKLRQAQKTLQNSIGYFHQHILGAVDNWIDPGSGGNLDLINDTDKIIVELKNKHNTMNSTSAGGTYRKMARHLDRDYAGYTGYVVTLIHKNPERIKVPFAPSEPGENHPVRSDLHKVDGATFYAIATGDRYALKKLYECLPRAVELALPGTKIDVSSSEEFEQLFDRTFGN